VVRAVSADQQEHAAHAGERRGGHAITGDDAPRGEGGETASDQQGRARDRGSGRLALEADHRTARA
jgi:hypothetical protein